MPVTFVVSTGRAGSTLLSRMLALHPQVLSVSEFFAVLQGILRRHHYPAQDMDGRELWRIASTPDPLADAMVRTGQRVPEMFYPYDTGRFKADAGIPIICHSTLSLLSDDPDALYDALAAQVPAWPTRTAADQYRALFGLLADITGRPVVVERSGGSLILINLLRREFPEARFVFMHRDGPDTALSMSQFPMFKLGVVVARAAAKAGLPAGASMTEIQAHLPAEYAGVLAPPYDLSGLPDVQISPVQFGELWSNMIRFGTAELGALPAEICRNLGYEDLLANPGAELGALAGFLGVEATGEWIDAAAKLVDPGRAGGAQHIDPDLLTQLRDACEPGRVALEEYLTAGGRTPDDACGAGASR